MRHLTAGFTGLDRLGTRTRVIPAVLVAISTMVLWGGSAHASPVPAGQTAMTWNSPSTIAASGGISGEQATVSLAMDAAGDAVGTWVSAPSGDCPCTIKAAVRPAGGSFATPVSLSSAGQTGHSAQVAMDAAGDAIVVWGDFNTAVPNVEASVLTAGGSFGSPIQVSTDATADNGGASSPGVAMDAAGAAVVVWHTAYVGGGRAVDAARRPAGGPFTAPQMVTASTDDVPSFGLNQQVAMSPDGHAAVAYTRRFACQSDSSCNGPPDSTSEPEKIQVATAAPGAAFGAPVDISPVVQNTQTDFAPGVTGATVATDDSGDVAVGWVDQPSSNSAGSAKVTVSEGGGSFGTSSLGGVNGSYLTWPAVAFLPNRELVTEWLTNGFALDTASRPQGGAFGSAATLAPSAYYLALATASNAEAASGDALAAWLVPGTQFGVHAALRPTGGNFGSPATLGSTSDGSTAWVTAAIDKTGDQSGVAWVDGDGAVRAVLGGTGGGNPTPPNTTITKTTVKAAQRKATFTFTGSGGTAPLAFKCKLDRGQFATCTSSKTYRRLASGSHTFLVEARDAASTVDPSPAKKRFTI